MYKHNIDDWILDETELAEHYKDIGRPEGYESKIELVGLLKQLKEYQRLEEQGRLIKLPCKIGTEVYNATWWDDVQEKVVVKGKTYYRTVHKHKVSKSTFDYCDIEEFGKTVFLTESEAEAKLEELKAMKNLDKTNFSDGYNRAIDDFLKEADEAFPMQGGGTAVLRRLEKIADRLKGGGSVE
nr:MAG TPA: hypothetical protein [Caudoviricetes sp.]